MSLTLRFTILCTICCTLQMPALAALAYHKLCGSTPTPPNAALGYAENLLYMLDAHGSTAYRPDPRLVAALETLLVLHAEHEMDCCTAAVRHLASRWACYVNFWVDVTHKMCCYGCCMLSTSWTAALRQCATWRLGGCIQVFVPTCLCLYWRRCWCCMLSMSWTAALRQCATLHLGGCIHLLRQCW
jgi:hypothetical protein